MNEYDVIVCGGGTAGAIAGIKSARMGARTLIIEEQSALGGTQALGWVTPMMPNYLHGEDLCRGINLEIAERLSKQTPKTDFPHAHAWYDPIRLSALLDELAREAGAECLFEAKLVSCHAEEGRIRSLKVHTKGGELLLSAKIYIDATGDADLAYLSGCQTESESPTRIRQPLTLRFTLGNVNTGKLAQFFHGVADPCTAEFFHLGFPEAKESPLSDTVLSAIEEGLLEWDDLGYFQIFTIWGRPGEIAFNCPRLSGFDPLDPWDRSRALRMGRQKIFRIFRFCQEKIQGFENAYVSVIAPLLGVRESRRIVGRYVLTEDDHAQCRKFPDPVARNRYPLDVHLPERGVFLKKLPENDYHEIPYRCLLPKEIKNLLVVGRCLSATFFAQSSVRIQPVCRALGEAGGTAAALCCRLGVDPANLPYEALRPYLDLSVG